jgi:hypothetical protein
VKPAWAARLREDDNPELRVVVLSHSGLKRSSMAIPHHRQTNHAFFFFVLMVIA